VVSQSRSRAQKEEPPGGPGDVDEPVVPQNVKGPEQLAAEMKETVFTAKPPELVKGVLDGGTKSFVFDPATNMITYYFSENKPGTKTYPVADALDGNVKNKYAAEWARANAEAIYAQQQAQQVYNAELESQELKE